MTSKWNAWSGMIVGMAGWVLACAPPAPAPAPLHEITLPAGVPIHKIPRATLLALGRQVSWTGCDSAVRNAYPSGSTTVEICAASYARDVGQGNENPTGVFVGRMVNLGDAVEARWGLMPKDTSFIVAFPSSVDDGRYALLEVPANTFPGSAIRVLVEGATYHYCRGHTQPAHSDAKFATCERALTAHSAATSGSESGPNATEERLSSEATDPAWLSCRTGCCTTEAAE